MRLNRGGLSLVEVLIGALIIGASALPVLELIRSGSAGLEITEIEAAARQLGADVLERVAGPRVGTDRGLSESFKKLKGTRMPWEAVIKGDPALARDFPFDGLRSLLDLHDVRLELTIQSPYEHPVLGPAKDLEAYVVKVTWKDQHDEPKEVTCARLVDL